MLALIEQVAKGELRGDAARSKVWECGEMYTMTSEQSSEIVRKIYGILSEQGEAAALLYASLVERGELMTLLEDIQMLSPSSRSAKWETDAITRKEEEAQQLAWAARTSEASRMRTENRRANRDAWSALDSSDVEVRGVELLTASEEELLLKSPPFWNNLPLEDMPESLMRACMGRIDALLSAHGRGRFPESLGQRYDHQLSRLPVPAQKTQTDERGDKAVQAGAACGCLSLMCRALKRVRNS